MTEWSCFASIQTGGVVFSSLLSKPPKVHIV